MTQLLEKAQRLAIHVGERTRFGHKPLYEAIMLEARRMGLAGATVTRGVMGYGANNHVHTAKILGLSEDLPVVVEIVDHPAKIEAFLPVVDRMMDSGLATVEDVRVVTWRGSRGA